MNKIATYVAAAVLLGGTAFAVSACSSASKSANDSDSIAASAPGGEKKGKVGGPQLGSPGGGPVIDKTGDATLQSMIKELVPKFRQLEFDDPTSGIKMKYNLFVPEKLEPGKKYPLVLFMADASTPGENPTTPLTQGYGALVWATQESQAKNPCFVLVPQYSGVAVNDAYEHTDEVDVVIRMLKHVVSEYEVDSNRLYTTGQSMGGMISMYYNVTYPDIFAASIFVDCHWATDTFGELAEHKFVYFSAGDKGGAWKCIAPLEEAAKKDDRKYEYAQWSARLPESEQNTLAQKMLDKGAPINLINFESGTVLPADGKGSEHMYSFDYAYKIQAVRDWLFRQSKK